ncbi:MAG TPA: hypothetical protein VI791_00610 [Patescibacteria group bacterium]|nr:hypothetical protein [Patescibacteria group bacterium]
MFNRLESKYKTVKNALSVEREIEVGSLSYERARLMFEVFLNGGWCDKEKLHFFGKEIPVAWWRCVELESNGVPYDLVVWTDPKEAGDYGRYAGNRSLAVINVTLNRRGGGQETVKFYPERWFMERDTLGMQSQVEKAVEDVADVAVKITKGEYRTKTY